MYILAIETSCDETAAAVLDDNRILSNVVWSQLKLHAHWGGVVPSIARRAHEERLPALVTEACRRANARLSHPERPRAHRGEVEGSLPIDAIAVTIGPGLAPALEVGIAYAKKLALQYQKPLISVSHLEGHIASLFLRRKSGSFYVKGVDDLELPVLNLIVSGGHTELVLSHQRGIRDKGQGTRDKKNSSSFGPYPSSFILESRLLGATLDDAAGRGLA